MDKVKISFIISNLGQGGAERQFLELVKNIDKNIFDVSVCLYAINKGIFFKEIENVLDINLIKNYLHQKNTILKIIEAILFIYKYLNNNNFDLVHTTLSMNGALVRFSAPKNYRDRIVYNVRTSFNLFTKKILFVERYLIRKSFLIANSRKAYEDFVRFMPDKHKNRMKFIYNGFDTNKFKPFSYENNSQVIIGNVGRIHMLKNQIQILRVVKTISINNVNVVIIGEDGGQKKILDKFISENHLNKFVQILPQQQNIEEYYNKFDIFILSSLLEGCPNVLFEAMLCQCFCVISQNGNSDNFIIDGENGLVYDGSDDGLKVKLEYAISIKGSEKYEKIKAEGYNYAKNNFSMEKMVKSYENLYQNIHIKGMIN